MGLGAMPAEYAKSVEGYVKFAREVSGIARILADNGKIIYNHNFEFVKFDGVTGLRFFLTRPIPMF